MTIPQLQIGLYMMSGHEVKQSVHWALGIGYRGIDCAQMYHNEREAGKAIRDFLASPDNTEGLTREDIFYTTKLSSNSTSYDAVRKSIKKSVDVSGLGYVDLFLLHSPYGGKEARLTSWRALEDAIDNGEVRMAGVSNYGVGHVSHGHFLLCLEDTEGGRSRNSWLQTRESSPSSTKSKSTPSTPRRTYVTLVRNTVSPLKPTRR